MTELSEDFQVDFLRLMRQRRDARRFRTGPVAQAIPCDCLATFALAPMGQSKPWRVRDPR